MGGSSGNSDTSSGEFASGDDGALFGDPDNPGSANDYATWNWHQIEAALDGGSMMTTAADQTRAKSVADPTTLWDAGNAFYTVQTTLSMIGESMAAQAKALAGDGGPWSGDAADAFMTMMTTFSNGVIANANALSGGAMGYSVPDQLTDNGNTLSWAQNEIVSIDEYYAAIAESEGADVINGLVQIHEKPVLVSMMTDQMRGVLNTVASSYTDTINNVKSPTPGAGNNPPPLGPPPPIGPPPPLGPPPSLSPPPNLTAVPPPGTGSPPPSANIGAPPPLSTAPPPGTGADTGAVPPPLGIAAPPGTGGPGSDGLGSDGLGSSPPPSDLAVVPPPGTDGAGSTGLGADTPPPDLAVVPPPGADDTGTGTGLPPLTSGDGEGSADDSGLGDGSGLGDAINPDTGTDTGSGEGLPGLEGTAPPGSEDLVNPPPLETSAPPGTGAPGSGLPLMPGTGAPGAALSGEPSDSSGLLSGDSKPFTGTTPPGEVGSETGTNPGGLGLDTGGAPGVDDAVIPPGVTAPGTGEGLGSGGMPLMPGAGAPGGLSSGEPSDSSGLLSGDSEPFKESAPPGEVGSDSGASAGAPGLGLGDDGLGSAPGVDDAVIPPGVTAPGTGEGLGSGGMPMMPGAGAPGAASSGEPSDSSGLLGADTEPWSGEGVPGSDDVGSTSGAGAGGLGLDGLTTPQDDAVAPPSPAESGSPVGVGEGLGSGGMPMMPGAGAPGAASSGEPSDSSGLLGADAEPWSGEGTAAGDEVGSPSGSATGGAGLGSDGLPLIPGAGALGSSGAAVGESSDSSGLLDGETGPWSDESVAGSDEVGSPSGAGPAEPGASSAAPDASAYQAAVYEEDDAYETGEDDEGGDWSDAQQHDGTGEDRVPVLGRDAPPEDPSGWDLAGDAAATALFTLGLWAARKRRSGEPDEEDFARIVSTEHEAWIDQDSDESADPDAEIESMPEVATWRPSRGAEGTATVQVGRRRLAPPPEGYDPEAAAAQQAAAQAEAEAAAELEHDAQEEAAAKGVADLLIQEPDMWGAPRPDWDAL